MILFAGIPTEPPLAMAIAAAEKATIPYIIFNQRETHFYDLSIKMQRGKISGVLKLHHIAYELEKIKGIYTRMMDPQHLPEIVDKVFYNLPQQDIEKNIQLTGQLLNWTEITEARVLNRPQHTVTNISKPFQSQLIASSGLLVPPTLVTSDVSQVMSFQTQNKELIFKSISSVRSIVKKLEGNYTQSLHKIRFLPVQFQKKLCGQNIRVHVVGDKVFATLIQSKTVDYRYAAQEDDDAVLSTIELPGKIRDACISLSENLGLPLCGIDLFLTDDDRYYCFEVNPSPGYSYYESHTGQKISASIVHWLEYGKA